MCRPSSFALRGRLAKLLGADVGDDRDHVSSSGRDRERAYAEALLAEAREELGRADTKASILLAVTAVITGPTVGGLVSGAWSPLDLAEPMLWCWWLGATAVAVGIALLAAAVYPRMRRSRGPKPSVLAYFADTFALTSPEEIKEAIARSSIGDVDRLTDQIGSLSLIIVRKYHLIRTGMWFALPGALVWVGSLLVNASV